VTSARRSRTSSVAGDDKRARRRYGATRFFDAPDASAFACYLLQPTTSESCATAQNGAHAPLACENRRLFSPITRFHVVGRANVRRHAMYLSG